MLSVRDTAIVTQKV